MLKCPSCESTNSSDSLYCTQCGTRLHVEQQQLIQEIERYKPEHHPAERLDVLTRLIESKPPGFQSYPGLTFTALVLVIMGTGLMIVGIVGFAAAYLPPLEAGASSSPDLSRLTLWAGAFLIGFAMVVNAEMLKLFVDLQENADRQSVALHGIFQLLMTERSKP